MLTFVANALWGTASLPAYFAFRRALCDPARAQRDWLTNHLRDAASTAFAREHAVCAETDIDAFRRRVPVRPYDELSPWVDRVRRGEANVLTAEPVKRLMTSSGSTAAVKLLPQTARLQREFDAAVGPWMVDLFRRHPRLLGGRAYWSVTPSTPPPVVETAVPVGFDDDAAYLGGFKAWLVSRVMAVPGDVARIGDADRFFGATARHLLARRDLALISVWHPSFLTLLLDRIRGGWDGLLATLPKKRRDGLASCGPDWPKVWPQLTLVSAWADAAAAGPAARLADALPGVAFQPKGLLATEGCVTIPFAGRYPLAVRSHFFEFEADDGGVLMAHELPDGGEYGVVLTTGGGLWRYRLGDRVRVDGFVGNTPSLRLVGRADRVVDRFGEKLSDGFVTGIIRELAPNGAFALLAPDGGRYVLYTDAPADDARLDAALRRNPHYDHCRNLGQLAAPRVVRVPADAYARFAARLQGEGMRFGDIKPASLDGRDQWDDWLLGRIPSPP